jgi:hypothetical protein
MDDFALAWHESVRSSDFRMISARRHQPALKPQ